MSKEMIGLVMLVAPTSWICSAAVIGIALRRGVSEWQPWIYGLIPTAWFVIGFYLLIK